MNLTSIVIALLELACVGFLGYLLMQIPMMAPFKETIQFAVIVLMVLFLLGLLTGVVPWPMFPAFAGARR